MIVFYSGSGAAFAPKHPSNPENLFRRRANLMLSYFEAKDPATNKRFLRYARKRRGGK